MSYMKNKIINAYKDNHLICICLNRIDWEKRLIGYVRDLKEPNSFKFEIIDEFGQRKGVRSIKFKSIKSLEIGGVYNDNLEKLNGYGFKKTKSKPKYIIVNKRNVYDRLNELKVGKTLCTFVFETEYSIGIVTACTESEFFISNVAYDGSKDGISVFDISMLTKIRYASNHENRISFLYSKTKVQQKNKPQS